jgi:hypothetical protein
MREAAGTIIAGAVRAASAPIASAWTGGA